MNKTFHIVVSLAAAMLLLSGEVLAEDAQPSPVVNEKYEMDSWTSAKEINTVEAYEIYLTEFASGRHAKFAQAAINKIKKAENPKGGEESSLSHAKDAGNGIAKQSAAPAQVPAPAPTEAPAASVVEPITATPSATPSSANTSASTGENAQKP